MVIDWITLAINSGISLILSVIMFTFGLRAGKERTDRKDIKEKYRGLTAHFQELLNKVVSDSPVNWGKFRGRDNDRTPIEEMIKNGQYIDLRNSLFPYLETLEKDVLKYGYYFKQLSNEAGDTVVSVLKNNQVDLIEERYSTKTNVSDIKDNSSYFEFNPAQLYFNNQKEQLISDLKDRDCGVCFRYVISGNIKYDISIRKQDIGLIDINKILSEIASELHKFVHKVELEEKEELTKRLNKAIRKLKKLTKEPFSFWSTVLNSIRDIFR